MERDARMLEHFIDALDTDEGLAQEEYAQTLAKIPLVDAEAIAERVEATDGYFYLASDAAWDLRLQYGFQTDWSPTDNL